MTIMVDNMVSERGKRIIKLFDEVSKNPGRTVEDKEFKLYMSEDRHIIKLFLYGVLICEHQIIGEPGNYTLITKNVTCHPCLVAFDMCIKGAK